MCGFIPVKIYTGEDLKWDTPTGCHFKSLLPVGNRAIGELKWDILILRWCKTNKKTNNTGLYFTPLHI
jgi:hypothetical protein